MMWIESVQISFRIIAMITYLYVASCRVVDQTYCYSFLRVVTGSTLHKGHRLDLSSSHASCRNVLKHDIKPRPAPAL